MKAYTNLFAALAFLAGSAVLPRAAAQDMPGPGLISWRPAANAGIKYPAARDSLRELLDSYSIIRDEFVGTGRPALLLAPQDPFVMSGISSALYSHAADYKFETVIVFGLPDSSKHEYFSFFDGTAFVTPLGNCMADTSLARVLSGSMPDSRLSRAGHESTTRLRESSIECQVPFIQHFLPSARIVPVSVGNLSREKIKRFACVFSEYIKNNKRVLVIISVPSPNVNAFTVRKQKYGFLRSYNARKYHSRAVPGSLLLAAEIAERLHPRGGSFIAPRGGNKRAAAPCGIIPRPDDEP